jgi:hypothetical protein
MKAKTKTARRAKHSAQYQSWLREVYERISYGIQGIHSMVKLKRRFEVVRPSIAAVTVGRNDDYMPDFYQRLQSTIEWNTRQLSLKEYIFVEWNPPAGRKLLSFDLVKQFNHVRAYVVPPEAHYALSKNPNISLMEYHAKNVGIYRATSDWIIATNADAAFGLDTVFSTLYVWPRPDVIMTAQRVEIDWRGPGHMNIKYSDCLRYKKLGTYIQLGSGEFLLASKELWRAARGYDESLVKHRLGCDYRGVAQMLALGAVIYKAGVVLHFTHPTSFSEQIQPHHGEQAQWICGLPYKNSEDWGMGNAREVQLAERVWRLEI